MQDKDTLRNLLISAGVFFLVLWALQNILPPLRPEPSSTPGEVGDMADRSGTSDRRAAEPIDASGRAEVAPADAPPASAATQAPDRFAVIEADREQTLSMGAAPTNGIDPNAPPAPYRMRLVLSNVGASIESATVTDHAEELGSEERYTLLTPIDTEDGSRFRSLAVEQITIDNSEILLHDKRWHVGPVTPYESEAERGQRIEFWIEIHENDVPAIKLMRSFVLPQQAKDLHRHDLRSTLSVENLSQRPQKVIVTYRGGVGIRRTPGARMDDRYIDWGVFDGTRVDGSRQLQGKISGNVGRVLELFSLRTAPNARFSWAATANTYFTATIAPLTPDGKDHPTYLSSVEARDLDGSPTTADDVTLSVVTRKEGLTPGGTATYRADIYLGEKDGDAFRTIEEYKRRNYYFQISKSFSVCTFGFLIELMIWLLNTIYFVTRDYGLAIIVLVLIVRTLLHPITKKGQVNMVRMQQRMGAFAPKVEELKKKFGNDKARLQQETMKLYREHGINPATQMLTCLPMFLQLPIWVALFLSLSNNIQLRHQPFVLFPWVNDLTAPDALFTFPTPITIPLVGWELPTFNLLPLLVALFMYLQQKLQPKPKPNPNATEQQRAQQEMMQKMMPLMSVMMLVFFYKMPSGLNLYIMFSSLFGAIEQHRIRKHVKEKETPGSATGPVQKPKPPKPKRPGGMSFFEKLQKMAEEAKKAQPRRPKKGKSRR